LSSLTIFSVPKPFQGHIGTIQRNAVESWKSVGNDVRIVLFGDDDSVAETAARAGVEHVGDIPRTELGTPLLNAVFDLVRNRFASDLACYVNGDIILGPDLAAAAARLTLPRFLILGRRWDLDVREPIDFERPAAREELRDLLHRTGKPHPPLGSDFFLYPRALDWGLPPFAVGRPGWDNWLIFRARRLGISVVDVSECVEVIHQNHDYGHVPKASDDGWEGPEADRNRALAGGDRNLFNLWDASHRLTQRGLQRAIGPRYLARRVRRLRETYLTRSRLRGLYGNQT
jgi:hypothetical protein